MRRDAIADNRFVVHLIMLGALTNYVCSGLQWYKAIAPPEIFGRLEPYEVPRKIDVPTQGIWASRDVFLTRAQMEGSSL